MPGVVPPRPAVNLAVLLRLAAVRRRGASQPGASQPGAGARPVAAA